MIADCVFGTDKAAITDEMQIFQGEAGRLSFFSGKQTADTI